MAIGSDRAVRGQLQTLFNVGAIRELSDGQLLERFATNPHESAELSFAVLVERHGSMVLRVCRGVLSDPHDTQDAFQATFLVLVKKARALWVRDSLGPWLHQVAYRTAMCARLTAARRRRHERRAAELFEEIRVETDDERAQVLHEEVGRLPERFRAPVVLCDLEGRTHEQAARNLNWPIGTVKSRLSRARSGSAIASSAGAWAPQWALLASSSSPDAHASIPPAMIESTTRLVVQFASGRPVVSAAVASLAQGVLRTMSITRWLKAAVIVLILGATTSGVELLIQDAKPGADSAREKGPPPVQNGDPLVAVVDSGKLVVTVADRGVIEATSSQSVYCMVNGGSTILLLVPEGSRVEKGDLVCELDSAALRERLAEQESVERRAEGLYQSAKLVRDVAANKYRKFLEETFPLELSTVKGEITATESAIQKADSRLARTRRAQQRLAALLAAKGKEVTPTDLLAELDVEDRLETVEQTLVRERIALDLAKAKMRRLENSNQEQELKADFKQTESDLLGKEQTHQLETSKSGKLRRLIKDCKILAPETGMVVYANTPNPGANAPSIALGAKVRERQKIFSVPNLAQLRVITKLPEACIDQVRDGLRAQIKPDAFPRETLTGVVKTVNAMPDATNAFSGGKKVYTTALTLDKPRPGLRPGMTVDVEILIAERDNVLLVPVSAVISRNGKPHVAVKTADGGFAWREVTWGISNQKQIEIRQGLEKGEKVILDPQSLLNDQPVRSTKPPE